MEVVVSTNGWNGELKKSLIDGAGYILLVFLADVLTIIDHVYIIPRLCVF